MRPHEPPQPVVSGAVLNRGMTKFVRKDLGKTCTLPHTILRVCADAFKGTQVISVRFNEGLRVLERGCFNSSGIRRLTLSSSVESIGAGAFCGCYRLEYADLSAARGLKYISGYAFRKCTALGRVLLNDGLETIGNCCFEFSGLEEVTIPDRVQKIGRRAFLYTHLRRVHFRGSPVNDHSGGSGEPEDSGSERQLVIGEEVFAYCICLRQVVFDPGSVVTEIQHKTFWSTALGSFIAPPSLRKIGDLVFARCPELRIFELNEDIQEIGWLCFWGTRETNIRLPPHVTRTPQQLGLDQDPKVLRFPDGLEVVRNELFNFSDIRKLIIPNTVKKLGDRAFDGCKQLREVVFEPSSRLETIGSYCFAHCGIEQVTVPKSVRDIGDDAFNGCRRLRSLVFEDGSLLEHVGRNVLLGTPLVREKGLFPIAPHAVVDVERRFMEIVRQLRW